MPRPKGHACWGNTQFNTPRRAGAGVARVSFCLLVPKPPWARSQVSSPSTEHLTFQRPRMQLLTPETLFSWFPGPPAAVPAPAPWLSLLPPAASPVSPSSSSSVLTSDHTPPSSCLHSRPQSFNTCGQGLPSAHVHVGRCPSSRPAPTDAPGASQTPARKPWLSHPADGRPWTCLGHVRSVL